MDLTTAIALVRSDWISIQTAVGASTEDVVLTTEPALVKAYCALMDASAEDLDRALST